MFPKNYIAQLFKKLVSSLKKPKFVSHFKDVRQAGQGNPSTEILFGLLMEVKRQWSSYSFCGDSTCCSGIMQYCSHRAPLMTGWFYLVRHEWLLVTNVNKNIPTNWLRRLTYMYKHTAERNIYSRSGFFARRVCNHQSYVRLHSPPSSSSAAARSSSGMHRYSSSDRTVHWPTTGFLPNWRLSMTLITIGGM